MSHESHEPDTELTPVLSEACSEPVDAVEGAASDLNESETQSTEWQHTLATPASTRHDGWTGDKMAIFCETLAETAVVAEACEQARMGISGAYAHRRRNPFFAAAWDSALTIARERLADTLLARSLEGNIEQIWRDGELVGERHVLDNRLGLAILRRLDRLAETGTTVSTRGERFPFPGEGRGPGAAQQRSPAVLPRPQLFDWELMVNALRTGEPDAIAEALAQLDGKVHKVEEVEDPPISLSDGDSEPEGLDLSDRCWKDHHGWLTNFPPPPGFDGYESGPYAGEDIYERACTAEEIAILEADEAADIAAGRAEEEALRDSWFAYLRDELEADPTRHPGLEPGSAFTSAAEGESQNPRQDRTTSDCLRE